ncbi:hypothetical protein BDV34DRAFT_88072 [Aspergillus parasiticus]|uniref:Uncharacterized protein n=1 Tax=Aspergillus parasiticus TaxID=5067 RepID=A0A5N6E5I5_ASPPA|nr:hypothetical protein BDV34DRAFT_88072 [Aspergillus parasiticus]
MIRSMLEDFLLIYAHVQYFIVFLAKTITTDSSSISQWLRSYNHSGGIEVLTSRSIVQLVESFTHKQKSSMPCFQVIRFGSSLILPLSTLIIRTPWTHHSQISKQFLEAIASIYGFGTVYEETSVSGRNVVFSCSYFRDAMKKNSRLSEVQRLNLRPY